MKIHDLTVTIRNGMPVWPGHPAVELERINDMAAGAHSNVSRLSLAVHTGTHVDAPVHFLPGGSGVESLPLDVLVGPAHVVELADSADVITAALLQEAQIPAGVERVLLKTRNSAGWKTATEFNTAYVGLAADGAEYLVARGIRLVGIDYLSVAPYKQSRPTHEALLNAGVVIVEGLDLTGIAAGMYMLVCLPMKLAGSDGAPARVVLIEDLE